MSSAKLKKSLKAITPTQPVAEIEGLDTAPLNAVEPSYKFHAHCPDCDKEFETDNGEWLIWCGEKHHAEAILKAARAYQAGAGGDEWLPIESAPRDGTEILAYWSLGHGSHGCTKFLKGEWVNPEDCDDEYCAPDFWQPLPAPPLTRKENGE